jgi:hypothetical protein
MSQTGWEGAFPEHSLPNHGSRELHVKAWPVRLCRTPTDPEDLLRALVGMCYAHDGTGWQLKILRLVDVFIDGLRQRPDHRHDRHGCDTD